MSKHAAGTLAALILTTLFAANAAEAGAGRWTAHGPGQGRIHALAIDPGDPDVLYAGTDGAGVFKSIDGGATWAASNQGLTSPEVHALAIDPTDPQMVFAGAHQIGRRSGGIFRSTDSGVSWTVVDRDLPTVADFSWLAIDPADPTTVYAGDYRAFRSTDRGDTWAEMEEIPGRPFIRTLAISPHSPHDLFLGAHVEGIFRSTDRGDTWTQRLDEAIIQIIAFDPSDPSILYAGARRFDLGDVTGGVVKSTDGGDTWAASNQGLPSEHATVTALAVTPFTPSIVYAALESGGVFRSTDRGESWTAVNSGLTDTDLRSLAISPLAPGRLFAGTADGGVFHSGDGGDTWTAANLGLVNSEIHALAVDGDGVVYAGTGSGAFKTAAGGDTWAEISAGLTGDGQDTSGIRALAIDPRDSSVVYAGASSADGVFKTTDGGAGWVAVNDGLATCCSVHALAVDGTNPDVIYAGRHGGLSKSTNAGGSWSSLLSEIAIEALAVDPSDPAIVFAATGNDGVLKSTDGGDTWTAANDGLTNPYLESLVMDPNQPSVLYASAQEFFGPPAPFLPGGIFKTLDGGGTWTALDLQELHYPFEGWALAIDPRDSRIVYAATTRDEGVLVSTDGGGTWTSLNQGLTEGHVLSLAIDPADPSTLYAGTHGGGVFHLAQIPPRAAFDFPAEVPAGVPVSFRDASSGPPLARLWSFGDGATSRELDPVHAYARPGRYSVTLAVSNAAGSDSVRREITVVACLPGPSHLCLNGGRFRVEVEWLAFDGATGVGRTVPDSADDSGLFWFFAPDNWELLVKVLDGCSFNQRFWVFSAATTNVGYTLRVTDTETGSMREYSNPLGRAAPAITDTDAFAACPGS